MFSRINFIGIIKAHLSTLRSLNGPRDRIYLPDLILFFIVPAIVSLFLTFNKVDLSGQLANVISAISILGGFLFNLLGIIYGLMDKLKSELNLSNSDVSLNHLKKTFMKEIHINISFNILVSVFCILLLIIYGYPFPDGQLFCVLNNLLLFLIYFLLMLFFLTLLMVLNRIYILFKKDVE